MPKKIKLKSADEEFCLYLEKVQGDGLITLQRRRNQMVILKRLCNEARRTLCQLRYKHVESRLSSLGIKLPPPGKPKANYNMFCWNGDLLFLSGHLPARIDGGLVTGRLRNGHNIEVGIDAARWCALNLISTLKQELGDLDRVEQIVKILGIVQSTDDFKEHHLVMNGCSDTLMEVFGANVGYHARSAVGTNSLPLDCMCEVEAIVRVKR